MKLVRHDQHGADHYKAMFVRTGHENTFPLIIFLAILANQRIDS